MNKTLLLAAALLLAFASRGQSAAPTLPDRYEKGIVYLKNGSVLKGKYLFSDDLRKLRLLSGKNSWVFNMEEVDRISGIGPVGSPQPGQPFTAVENPKWYNLTEIGILAGHNENNQPAPLVFSSSLNYQFLKKLSAGAGVGVEFMRETYLPVTVNLQYKVRTAGWTPFLSMTAGYQVAIEDSRTTYYDVVPENVTYDYIWLPGQPVSQIPLKAQGGLLLHPSFGILKHSWQGMGMSLSFGYRFHQLRYKASDDYTMLVDYNRLSLKLGLVIF